MKIAKKCYSIVVYILWKKVVLLFKSAFGPYKIDEIEKCNTTYSSIPYYTLSSIFKA